MTVHEAKSKTRGRVAALLCSCLLLTGLPGCGDRAAGTGGAPGNRDEVVASVRRGLRDHSRRITVSFYSDADLLDALPGLAGEWVEEALAETEDPAEGDYIRYQYGGYEVSCAAEREDARYLYTVSIVPDYYDYLYQEELAGEKLAAVMEGFGFDETTTDYEKLRAVYDYVCGNIRYDVFHRRRRYYTLRSTAYAGLVLGTATCQGYCVTLYRMLRTAGIGCRVVTGTGYRRGSPEYHAWVIAALDGEYYALDPTWDAGREEYGYFLKGSADFPDHAPGEAFLTEEFTTLYPMAERAYASAAEDKS